MTSVPTNNPKILDALWIAYTLHDHQVDKAKAPYIFHPYNVACRVIEYFNRYPFLSRYASQEVCIIAALLHDTIEDAGYTWERINERFGVSVANLVKKLTKTNQIKEDEYYAQISKAPAALVVKLADLSDNLRTDRLEFTNEKDEKRRARYEERHAQLMEELNDLLPF